MPPDESPCSPPEESVSQPPTHAANPRTQRSRLALAVRGAWIGLGVGVFWSVVLAPLTARPSSVVLAFLVYATGLAVTGFVVGLVRRVPPLVGALVGAASLCVWAFLVGPKDGWIGLWFLVLGGSGLLWGTVIGAVFWFLWQRPGPRSADVDALPETPDNPYSSPQTGSPADAGRGGAMAVARGVFLVVACTVLFAACGGLIAAGLNRFAPGFYPGVFPRAHRGGLAADVGIGTGIVQGVSLGLLAGTAVAMALAWFRQLRLASSLHALAVLLGFAAAFAVVGTLVGFGLGVFNPGYYRSLLPGGSSPDFNPVDVGIGLGCSQGTILGVVVGVTAVVLLAWRRARANVRQDAVAP